MIKLDDNWSLEVFNEMRLIIHSTCIAFKSRSREAFERAWYCRNINRCTVDTCKCSPSKDIINKAKFIAGKKLYIG